MDVHGFSMTGGLCWRSIPAEEIGSETSEGWQAFSRGDMKVMCPGNMTIKRSFFPRLIAVSFWVEACTIFGLWHFWVWTLRPWWQPRSESCCSRFPSCELGPKKIFQPRGSPHGLPAGLLSLRPLLQLKLGSASGSSGADRDRSWWEWKEAAAAAVLRMGVEERRGWQWRYGLAILLGIEASMPI